MTEGGEVRFGDARIRYQVVRSPRRHKTIEITVDEPGLVTVAAPADTPAGDLESAVRRRAGWIIRHDGEAAAALPPRRFVSGESLPYLGRSVLMTVHATDGDEVAILLPPLAVRRGRPEVPRGRGSSDDGARGLRGVVPRARRGEAPAARRAHRQPPRCSAGGGPDPQSAQALGELRPDGTLRFNWRAIMAPPELLDYVVAHELAHLRVRGHTPEYWAIVAQAVPDYRLRRARLRELGPRLGI